jgi:hypothetical protein
MEQRIRRWRGVPVLRSKGRNGLQLTYFGALGPVLAGIVLFP